MADKPHWYDGLLDAVEAITTVAYTIRASVLVVTIVTVLVLFPNQSKDSLRTAVEDMTTHAGALATLICSTLLLSVLTWYWARNLLYLRNIPDPTDTKRFEWAVTWLPRLFGAAPLFVLGIALLKALPPARLPGYTGPGRPTYVILAVLSLLAGIAFLVLTKFRRRLMGNRLPASPVPTARQKVRELSRAGRRIFALMFLFWVAMFLIVLFSPLRARNLGTIGMVTSAAAAWVTVLSFLVWWSGRLRTLRILLVFAIVISYFDCNDNHRARTIASVPVKTYPDVAAAFTDWLAHRPDGADFAATEPYPVVLVSAEGGGIAAGYWAAHVLAVFADRDPSFAQHVFAISGVSGGSLGAATFAALGNRSAARAATQPANFQPPRDAVDTVGQVLRRDFLAPVTAIGLYPDLFQRFLPVPFERFDRGAALEVAFSDAWHYITQRDDFIQPLASYGTNFASGNVPALFLNATQVETGHRFVMSNLSFERAPADNMLMIDELRPRPTLRLSTAVGLSARFPLVTPAAFLPDGDGKRRFVDGGYFENSGAHTLLDVMNAMGLADADGEPGVPGVPGGRRPYKVIVLHIGFKPPAPRQEEPSADPPTAQGLGESLSPLRALMNTRTARGEVAVEAVRALARSLTDTKKRDVHVFDFELDTTRNTIPLGWSLSRLARAEIESQLPNPNDDSSDLGIRPQVRIARADPIQRLDMQQQAQQQQQQQQQQAQAQTTAGPVATARLRPTSRPAPRNIETLQSVQRLLRVKQ